MAEDSLQFDRDAFSLDVRVNGPAPKSQNHYHNSFELYYLQKGTCWYFIDEKSYRLTAGDIALIPVGVIHKTSYATPTSSRTVFNCAESFIPRSVIEQMYRTPYFASSAETAPTVNALISQICAEYERPDAYSADALRIKVAELFLFIARESGKTHVEKKESPIVEKAVSYIRKHYMESVTLQDVAISCYVSREHLSRIFKKETGFGFNEYLTVYRMKKAKAMMTEDPKIKVAQVALRCGFNDSNYFSKLYKKVYGVAPTSVKRGG